jgi:polyribonucleotide nucleotidyltransferase
MMIGASMDSINVVEGEMKEISEAEMLEAIKFAHEQKSNLCSTAFTSCFWKKKFVLTTRREEISTLK